MKLVKRDIRGENLVSYQRDVQGNSLLHDSIINNDTESFCMLVNERKLINLKNNCNETPLHLCAEFNRKKMAIALIKQGAYQDYKNYVGWTPLFQSLISGSYDTFEFLLNLNKNIFYDVKLNKRFSFKRYFNPFIVDSYGYTIVHHAYVKSDKRYLRLVVEKLRKNKIFYVEKNVSNWNDPSFIKLYDSETFKEEYYELNKDAFSYDTNRN